MAELTMDKLVALCKNRGFIFAGSEIYGGLANTWDYGPLGVELKNNVKKRLVAEVCPGKQVQHWPGQRHPDEPGSMGSLRPRGRLQRPAHGLQGLQGPLPRRQAH